jgi:hypothetical protein
MKNAFHERLLADLEPLARRAFLGYRDAYLGYAVPETVKFDVWISQATNTKNAPIFLAMKWSWADGLGNVFCEELMIPTKDRRTKDIVSESARDMAQQCFTSLILCKMTIDLHYKLPFPGEQAA